ncbi:MAG: MFS transporter [Actinomycetota bacterium]
MHTRGHVRAVLRRADFRRLYGVRLGGQFGDGVFQASLAGAVLFNPQRATTAADVAAGFAVLLLPYSLIGPFAGVLLDRWWRQRVLLVVNVLRGLCVGGIGAEIALGVHGLPFYASALVVVSMNRFFLSALGASLPHVVDRPELVTANSVTTTSGAIATTLGGAIAVGVRALVGASNASYALVALTAAVPYLVSAIAALGFTRYALGPDAVERGSRDSLRDIAAGLIGGARHIVSRRSAFYALLMVGVHRFCYGVSVICVLLLYRNYFVDEGFFRAGLAGLTQLVVVVAIGGGLAAVLTPMATRRLGFVRWPAFLLSFAAVVEIVLGLPYSMPLLLIAAGCLGFAAQAIKISVDTLVQRSVDEGFRGRVFSIYDTLFNLTFVGAAVLTALTLPDSGYSPASVVTLGTVYALTALVYLRVAGREAQVTESPGTVAADPTPV